MHAKVPERTMMGVNPGFSPVSMDMAQEYVRLYSLCPSKSSYYSFGSLWAWRDVFRFTWAFERGLCWIGTEDGGLWAPVGPWDRIPWREVLPGLFPGRATFSFVPEELARQLKEAFPGQIAAREDRSQWEYLHSVRDLIELRGNRFSRKRWHIRQFEKNHAFTYRSLSRGDGGAVLECQRLWLAEHSPSFALSRENEAISRMIRDWSVIPGLLGGIIEVNGNPVAYTVAEALTEDMLMIHFEKGLSSYNGAYQVINRMFLERTASSFSVVNREEDLGEEGMRVAKMSYHPVGFLKKCALSWCSG